MKIIEKIVLNLVEAVFGHLIDDPLSPEDREAAAKNGTDRNGLSLFQMTRQQHLSRIATEIVGLYISVS